MRENMWLGREYKGIVRKSRVEVSPSCVKLRHERIDVGSQECLAAYFSGYQPERRIHFGGE